MAIPIKLDSSTTPTALEEIGIGGDEALEQCTLPWSKVTSKPTEFPVIIAKAGTPIGTRDTINLIEGTNVTLTVTDDGGNDRVNVTVNSSGGGGASNPTITDLGNISTAQELTIDGNKGWKLTATGNQSISFAFSGLTSTLEYMVSLQITQDGTGGRTLTFTGTNIDTPSAIMAIPIDTVANRKTLLFFRVHNSRVELINIITGLRNS